MTANLQLIPVPKTAEVFDGVTSVACSIYTEKAEWKEAAGIFADYFTNLGTEPTFAPGGIELVYDETVRADGYIFDSTDGIRIYASAKEGVHYGLATAMQLTRFENGLICADKVRIEDWPDKDYRGLMVDLARCWHPFHTLFKYVDICWYYKVKYLQLHFIDDQLYTLPSRVFPKISTPGKHYTFEQIEEIRCYAEARGLVIVPEFEAPGHASAMNAAYPEVFGDIRDPEAPKESYSSSIICGGSEKAMEGVCALIKEVTEMFPNSPYIHIGGDEAIIRYWNDCSVCREYMKKNGLEDVHELYSDFVSRTAKYVLSLGRTPIVWEGFPKKGHEKIPKETIVIAWESYYQMCYELLEEGFRIINCSWQPLYIVPSLTRNWGVKEILDWNVYNWQHWMPSSPAKLNPVNLAPTDEVWGAQLCSWECSYEQEINRIMENLGAMSERSWSVKRICDDETYFKKQRKVNDKLARMIVG
ncbi:MAG: family 20 glycosylhydrolase [Oscillospiraceae bacterium]|nr:family 20 glycosylhydrolase [Oscillospiraceae bacterium]